MKQVVSVSLGSSRRDKRVEVTLNGVEMILERIGTNGDIEKSKQLFESLDGKVDVLSVGGVDLHLRLDKRIYPLYAARKLVENVHHTPVVDGQGLKNTLERRVFQLIEPEIGGKPHFGQAFMAIAVDRLGMAQAVSEVTDSVIFGDFLVALGIPILVRGLARYRKVLRVMLPLVSRFPMRMLYYDTMSGEADTRFEKYWKESDLIACDFMFLSKTLPDDLSGKTILTNTTMAENIQLLKDRRVSMVITSTPQYDGRSFGTNLMEAALTAYAGKGRVLTDDELNQVIDEIGLKPAVHRF